MTMHGFDTKFKTFPDYILGITHEIWEGRGVDTLNHYYSPDILVRSPSGITKGNQTVITATQATLAEFPDRQLLGEDVIWSGDPQVGMLSSHRIFSTATHATDGIYGKASGVKLGYRVIADCHAINNQINDEWLIRDQGAIVRALGWTPRDFAAKNPNPAHYTPQIDTAGPYTGTGNDNEWGARMAAVLIKIMDGDDTAITQNFDRAAQVFYAGGMDGHGTGDVRDFWLNLRASFPSATFTIHHCIGRADAMMPPRAALRWSLDGRHDGTGGFGKPTGAKVHIMGMTHAEFGPFGVNFGANKPTIRREFTLIDEVAIWQQILNHTGDHG